MRLLIHNLTPPLQIMATSSMILLVAKLLPFLFEPKILTRLSTSWQYEAWPPSCCQMVESKYIWPSPLFMSVCLIIQVEHLCRKVGTKHLTRLMTFFRTWLLSLIRCFLTLRGVENSIFLLKHDHPVRTRPRHSRRGTGTRTCTYWRGTVPP